MSSQEQVTGMVLFAAPSGDYDRRIILLTKERGKITAFARGARRPRSALQAASVPLTMGVFTVFEGRDAYTLTQARILQYFPELKADYEGTCYGAYFAELAEYYGRENLDCSAMLNLLYLSLTALTRPSLPRVLVRAVYEIRLIAINGELPLEQMQKGLSETALYALSYIAGTPLEKLYTFTLSEGPLREIREAADKIRRRTVDARLRSLTVLEEVTKGVENGTGSGYNN